ncbi:unnamed protein product, partial [Brenthis ino]
MDETESDAPFGINSSNSTKVFAEPVSAPEISYYDMNGEKYLYIFNHYKYQKTRYFGFKRPQERTGSIEDVRRLSKIFQDMNYKVTTHQDLEHSEILNVVKEISQKDHKSTSCLCFVFLTHGDRGGELFAADRPYLFTEVTVLLEHGDAGLVGKPKLFFIQACRGDQKDDGRRIETDGQVSIVIPTQADFFTLYSTVENYVAYRDSEGSFLMQELCNIIEEYHDEMDILHMVTLVQMRVAYYRSTFAPSNQSIHNKKQMPETRFTLTKLFKF